MKKRKRRILTLFAVLIGLSVNAQQVWTLQACFDTAYIKNISLNQEQLSSQINNINLTKSKAAVYPNLNLSDVHSFTAGHVYDPYTTQYNPYHITDNTLALNSQVTLFNGYLLLNTVKQSKLNYQVGELDVEKTKNDIMLNVLAGFMQVLMDYEAIDVANAQVEATTTQTEQMEKFVKYGKNAELSLLQIQTQLAADKLTKVIAENQLQLDKVTLMQLMDVPVRNDFDIERLKLKDLFPEIPLTTEEINKVSLSFLPQIKSAMLKTDAALYSLKMAQSGVWPKLTLGGTLQTGYNNSISSDEFKNNFAQALNVTLSIPIFNNLQVKSNVDIAKINLLNIQLNEQQTKNDVRKSIETAYTNEISAGKKLMATEEQMVLETRTYNDMEKKFVVGAIDATTFLIEKNNYNKVSMSLIQTKYDYVLKTKMVDFYLNKPLTFK